ncbi:MAG: hypothetical protein ACXAB5_00290, partial [Candidatus Thorarchaeota archaeon]
SVETFALLFFSTDLLRELVVRAMMFHKNYYSNLVYIAEPLVRVTERSHILLLSGTSPRRVLLAQYA